jgi:capsular polysaccharide biosynthesis protein
MDFAEQFAARNEQIKAVKMVNVVRRAMAIQARSKIKPNSMRPSLQMMSLLRGGDATDTRDPLNLYYPGR